MPISWRSVFTYLVWLFMSASSLQCDAAEPWIWRNDWTVQLPPSLTPYYYKPEPIAFAANGDILLGSTPDASDHYSIARVDAAGAPRWAVNFGTDDGDLGGVGTLIPAADGGALVAVGDPSFGDTTALARITAEGSIAWLSRIPVGSLVVPTDGVVVTAGCEVVSELDATTGQTLWQQGIVTVGGCENSLAMDDQGNIYAASSVRVDGYLGLRLLKIDGGGQVIWSVTRGDVTLPEFALIDVSAGFLFLSTSVMGTSGMMALRAEDGTEVWSKPQLSIMAFTGDPAEPVVYQDDTIMRLAAADGQVRWTSSLMQDPAFAKTVDNRLLVGSDNGLADVDPDTGATTWSAALPSQDSSGRTLQFVAIGSTEADTLVAVASARASDGQLGTPPAFLQPLLANNGQMLPPVAISPIPHSVDWDGASILEDDAHIAGAALVQGSDSFQVLVRRLDAASGQPLWNQTIPLQNITSAGQLYGSLAPGWPAVASAGGVLAVATAANGFTWVGAFDDANGVLLWQKYLFDSNQQGTSASAPVVDSFGNVYIAYGGYVPMCTNGVSCDYSAQQSLLKLAAADGAVVWRHDEGGFYFGPYGEGIQVFPPYFAIFDTAVILAGPPAGPHAADDLIALSVSDGSPVWTSSAFGSGGAGSVSQTSDGNYIATGAGGWAMLDAGTGAVLWANAYVPLGCSVRCYQYGSVNLANGDIYFVGEGDGHAFVQYLPATPFGVETTWWLDADDANSQSYATQIAVDSTGVLWIRLGRRVRSAGMDILARFDPDSGMLLSQQAFAEFGYDILLSSLEPTFLASPENHRLPVATSISGDAVLPTIGNALLDDTIDATGDLTVEAGVSPTIGADGHIAEFHVAVKYSGDAAISGAHATVVLPWSELPRDVSCLTQSASNCIVDARSQNIHVSFDSQPGGSIDISGAVLATPGSDGLLFQALTYGPVGLNEQDTLNNFAQITIQQSLFANGFD